MQQLVLRILCVVAVAFSLAACTNPYDPAQRAVGGGLIGAGTGATLGAVAGGGHGAALGALIGGAVGAVGGAATTPPPPYAYGYPPPRYGRYASRRCGPYGYWVRGHWDPWGRWMPGHCVPAA